MEGWRKEEGGGGELGKEKGVLEVRHPCDHRWVERKRRAVEWWGDVWQEISA